MPKRSITFLVVWSFSLCYCAVSESEPVTEEFCNMEEFKPQCSPNEVILMESAMYGRMRPGRCAVREYGPIGCGSSVMAITDRRCSGRRSCKISIPDHDMHAVSGCPSQATSHLEAAYSCLPVAADYDGKCSTGTPVTLTSDVGYIVNHVAFNPSTQHAVCTWRIRVAPGQRIELTLYDFGRHRSHRTTATTASGSAEANSSPMRSAPRSSSASVCRKYAVVRETGTGGTRDGDEKVICSGVLRERIVYTSRTNAIDVRTFATVVVAKTSLSADGPRFIIRYNAIGCADLQLGGNVVVRRESHLAVTVSCDNTSTSIRHHLVCKDHKWTGDLPMCPDPHYADHEEPYVDWWSSVTNDWTYAILTTVGLGVALGVVVGVSLLLATLAYCKRKSGYNQERLRSTTEKYYSTPNVVDLPSADELRFYYDESGTSKDGQTFLPLTRLAAPLAECAVHSACRAPDQTTLTDSGASRCDAAPGSGMTCVCSTAMSAAHHPGGSADCSRHQRTVLLVREHAVGYET